MFQPSTDSSTLCLALSLSLAFHPITSDSEPGQLLLPHLHDVMCKMAPRRSWTPGCIGSPVEATCLLCIRDVRFLHEAACLLAQEHKVLNGLHRHRRTADYKVEGMMTLPIEISLCHVRDSRARPEILVPLPTVTTCKHWMDRTMLRIGGSHEVIE